MLFLEILTHFLMILLAVVQNLNKDIFKICVPVEAHLSTVSFTSGVKETPGG
jgi:hypothetical protein